ncbi:ArsA family ATPase [Patulibacter americanus]|uniref:ArsA family ATPase n=1 Tax=Patulibacter americanus TaxID=588672 RepID=UPI0003B6C9C6|nr:ArsA-related P-loop ATPase [Patulibacter americanus]
MRAERVASTLDLTGTTADARVIVLAGGGGVGKTTTAAGIGLGLARTGRRVCVLTIDPARRLADALGLEGHADEPVQVPLPPVDPDAAEAAGVPVDGDGDAPAAAPGRDPDDGELWVVMLDAKSTWDGLIRRHSETPEAAERLLQNRVYREFSSAVAGTQEYMAVEKLQELLAADRWDVVLLDTPPTRNALDFLDAPQRLHAFLDSRALQLLLRPAAGSLGLIGRGANVFTGLLKRVTGMDLLSDLTEFFSAASGLTAGFSQRAKAVGALLAESRTVFLLVASPRPDSLAEAGEFRRTLAGRDIHYGGLIVNRMTRAALDADDDAVRAAFRAELDDEDTADAAATMHEGVRSQAARDERLVAEHLARIPGDDPLLLVPQLAEDVHDVAGLQGLTAHLFDARA